jgi:transcriptional regulator with XRE-family HTH domain
MLVNKFRERFKELLEEKGMSQSEFARRYSIPRSTVNSWCTHREPTLDYLIQIAKIFNTTADFLLGIVDN